MAKLRSILYATLSVLIFAAPALAQTAAGDAGRGGALLAQTGAVAVAIAALGGALGDGRAIAAACAGTARNPAASGRIFTMMLLGLALIETLVLFTFAAAYLGL